MPGLAASQQLPEALSADDFLPYDEARAALGQMLFYDPILSGNRNISCGTCHHHAFFSADGQSLGVGEGGTGLGPDRLAGQGEDAIEKRIPRNAPALFNLGAREIRVMFHDGRLELADFYENGYNSPAEEYLPAGLSLLAAQALLPVNSEFEMAGNPEENKLAGLAYDQPDLVWAELVNRLRATPAYGPLFLETYPEMGSMLDLNITHVATALADFINAEWQSYDSPFDRYQAGDAAALNAEQLAGMALFFGEARCATCHSGPLFTDQEFYALALPHFGPGRTRRFDPMVRDVGRMGVTDRIEDAYRFRTPSLRNVTRTAPYGHNGAYASLTGIIAHHANPVAGFANWDPSQIIMADAPWLSRIDFVAFADTRERARLANKIDIEPVDMTDTDIAALISFLGALEGGPSLYGRLGVPAAVPSGLPVDRGSE
jgi:cytochrome c peroxidase